MSNEPVAWRLIRELEAQAEEDTALLRQALEALEYEAQRGNDDAYRSLRDALSERLGEKT
jgi:hypothetical protein